MITFIIDWLVQITVQIIGALGYPGVFLLMLIESCGVPFPSEVIMPFAGFLVAAGRLNFWLVVVLGGLGNLFGSLLAYYVGRVGGRPLIEKYGRYVLISRHDLDLADRWFTKRGDWTVFLGRFLPVIRTYISFPAGIAQMKVGRFSFYTFLGALPWSALFTWLGVKLGNNWELVREKLHDFDMLILGLVILVIVLYVWRHLRQLKKMN
ncbi:MAG: DedA family protein [Patescibacteria group bacterium]